MGLRAGEMLELRARCGARGGGAVCGGAWGSEQREWRWRPAAGGSKVMEQVRTRERDKVMQIGKTVKFRYGIWPKD